jgi:2-polyprenyl-3-methyl-5-hydroxy-6-metoxy-1,4-benzoquinol methylase
MNKDEYNKIITKDTAYKYYEGIYKERNLEIVDIINNEIKNNFSGKNVSILDLAAGCAQIAQYVLKDNSNIVKYVWNDFADNIIDYAKGIIKDDRFIINTDDCMNIKGTFDIVICISLEHILEDIKLINNFSENTFFCICSPNFDSKGHYRFYNNVNEMINRYESLFNKISYKIISHKK